MSYNIGFAIGALLGVLLGVGVLLGILIITTKNHTVKRDYDERQELVRGKGYKYGFLTMLIANMTLGYISLFFQKPIMDTCFSMVLSMALGGLVNIHYCIWKEGYFSLNEKPKVFITIMAILAVWQYASFAGYLKSGVVVDGMITYRCTNLVMGVLLTFTLVDLLAKSISQKREDD